MEVDDRGWAVFGHQDFAGLLGRFVRDGGVRYDLWARDTVGLRQLDEYLQRIRRASPDSAPNLFPAPADRALYWIWAHNAFAIRSILDHWPVEKLSEIGPRWHPFKGYVHLHKARFVAGGKKVSLVSVVNRWLARESEKDARLLLLLNWGSRSCAPLRPEAPLATSLGGILAEAASTFLADPQNLAIDHEARRLRVSGVFRRGMRLISADPRSGKERGRDGLRQWLLTVAPPARGPDLALARDYAIEFTPWDWSVNLR